MRMRASAVAAAAAAAIAAAAAATAAPPAAAFCCCSPSLRARLMANAHDFPFYAVFASSYYAYFVRPLACPSFPCAPLDCLPPAFLPRPRPPPCCRSPSGAAFSLNP